MTSPRHLSLFLTLGLFWGVSPSLYQHWGMLGMPVSHVIVLTCIGVAAALALGPAVGTLTGGLILEEMGWRPIFWIFGAVTLLWLVPWHYVAAPLRTKSVSVPVVDPVQIGRAHV